jgi:predicted secreted acid phosphatase
MLKRLSNILALVVMVVGSSAYGEPANLGALKADLIAYHSSQYASDVSRVVDDAASYVESRAGKAIRPALVLDIDETSLSNWIEIAANDFGYIPSGTCADLPKGPCGARAWELSAQASAIEPTLGLFRLAKARGVAVFFVSGRPEEERAATEVNLKRVGYEGWAGLIMVPPQQRPASIVAFKAPARAKIESDGYTIIATVGDQQSDLDGGHAERGFKLPNPFYLIK